MMSRSLTVGAGWTEFEVSLFDDIRYRLEVNGQVLMWRVRVHRKSSSRVGERWLLLLLFMARAGQLLK